MAVVLLAAWMGDVSGGYFVGGWALLLAVLLLVAAVLGILRGTGSWWIYLALGSFVAYMAWTFASLLWSPNQGDAWIGAGQTLLYLLAFCLAVAMVVLGASRRWVLAASVIGPAIVVALTLQVLPDRLEEFLPASRLIGTTGYGNGEAAFPLVTFWAAIYLAGSRRVNPVIRVLALSGAVLALDVAVLTQSRGAAFAMVLSLPVYFLLSGQRLRGLISLAPVAAILVFTFPSLNAVYQQSVGGGDPAAALNNALPTIWITAALAGVYALLWSFLDRQWRPPAGLVRFIGGLMLVAVIVAASAGSLAFVERFGSPVAFAGDQWQAFKTDDRSGQQQSRYLSASGSGRYLLWQTAWEGFTENPVLGVGTQNFEATYYQERDRLAHYARQPHTLPIEILAERGVVGGVLFLGFLIVSLAAGLRERFKNLNSEGEAQVGAMVAAVAYWFIHSSVEWFWQLPAVTLPAIIYLAMLVGPWSRRAETIPFGWPMRTAAVTLGIFAIVAVTPLYISNYYLQKSYEAANPSEALQDVEKAQTFNPVNPRLFNTEAELAIELGEWNRVENTYMEAIRRNPEHYESYMFLAQFYERRAEFGKALEFYRKALARNPQDPKLQEKVRRLSEMQP
jgi:tetratricopeptide (TPR) repeat protein